MHKNIIVSIHQPNFFPWLGFFDKLIASDVFLLMDTAQIPNKKPSFTNRTKILIEREERWCPTIEIYRNYEGVISIKDTLIVHNSNCRSKIIKTIQFNYRKAPFYNEIFPFLEDLILYDSNNLSDYNIYSLMNLIKQLNISTTKLIKTSDLGFEMSKDDLSELVTKMVLSVSGNTYLSGTGAFSYMNRDIFDNAGIDLIFQSFNHPIYHQFNRQTFVPGLSIIDALMNLGFQGVKELLSQKK